MKKKIMPGDLVTPTATHAGVAVPVGVYDVRNTMKSHIVGCVFPGTTALVLAVVEGGVLNMNVFVLAQQCLGWVLMDRKLKVVSRRKKGKDDDGSH